MQRSHGEREKERELERACRRGGERKREKEDAHRGTPSLRASFNKTRGYKLNDWILLKSQFHLQPHGSRWAGRRRGMPQHNSLSESTAHTPVHRHTHTHTHTHRQPRTHTHTHTHTHLCTGMRVSTQNRHTNEHTHTYISPNANTTSKPSQ